MKIDIGEIKGILKSIGKEYGWLLIPLDDDIESLQILNGTFIHYTFSDGLLELEYSENGLTFNLYSDWYVTVDNKGKFKGKGSVRHRRTIENTIKWFLKVIYDENIHKLLDYYPY